MTPITVRTFTPEQIISKAASTIAEMVQEKLTTGKVLLLLSGGSAIEMYKPLFEQLAKETTNGEDLTVSLFDERFVPESSADSNGKQLETAGIIGQIEALGGQWWPYLEDGETGEVVSQRMSHQFSEALEADWQLIILAGVGDDGHTAGLLPTTDQTTIQHVFESPQLVTYYQLPTDASNPHRLRVTATPRLVSQADQIVIYAVGSKKEKVLAQLLVGQGEVNLFPALSLRTAEEVTVLTDQTLK